MKKLLSLVMALAVLASLGAGSALAAADLGGGLGTELENAGVDVAGSASDEVSGGASSGELSVVMPEEKEAVIVEASGPVDSVSVEEGQELRGPSGEIVTMTIDGVQTDIAEGETYSGNIVLTLTDEDTLLGPNMGTAMAYWLRAAEYYKDGVLVESKSVADAVGEDGSIVSVGANFNGVMLTGSGEISVGGYDIDFTGWGENDMGGVGAAVYAVGDGLTANIADTTIRTRGATRTAVFAGGDSTVNLNDVHVFTYSGELPEGVGDLNNMEVPWMLGLIGDCRATNALGGAAVTWTDSTVVAHDWGALSTDSLGSSYDAGSHSGGHVSLDVVNSYIATVYSGYGAYADGAAQDRFIESTVDVADTALIMTGTGEGTFEGSYVNAGANAVMVHAGGGGTINAVGSLFHVGGTAFLIKDSAMTVNIDGSYVFFDGTAAVDPTLAAAYGLDLTDPIFDGETYDRALYNDLTATNIVKVQHNADAGSGADAAQSPVVVNVSNSELTGDFLNTCADVLTVTTTLMGSEVTRDRPSRSLIVNLTDSSVTGAISLGEDVWDSSELVTVSGGVNDFRYASGTILGCFTDGEQGLELTLTGSDWTVTRDSYLTKLTLDDASSIEGVITVDGEPVELAPGTYEGEIIVAPLPDDGAVTTSTDPAGDVYLLLDDLLRALGF